MAGPSAVSEKSALILKILDRQNMETAWEQVRARKGVPGLDGVTLERWGRNWEANIERLRSQVRTNTYHPGRPKRIRIHKKGGGYRELALLNVTDKVLQRAVLNHLDPEFDRRFLGCSHGYRSNHSTATAIQQVLNHRDCGLVWVLDADIQSCFDSIDHTLLMERVKRVVSDWTVLNLMEQWLKAGRKHRNKAIGIPAGAVISPLWCNVYLHLLDARLSIAGWKMVRYADDFIVMTAAHEEAEQVQEIVAAILDELKLAFAPEKTSITCFRDGFRFLGVDFYRDTYSYTWEEKRIKVKGRNLKMLYRHVPYFY